mmetsp:Transcript_80629/g.233816  ORF Transcript_80629/g.233816 Transcript_80629/m.233816 type:complete len:200 (-) Transcript_80629:135-734(-)
MIGGRDDLHDGSGDLVVGDGTSRHCVLVVAGTAVRVPVLAQRPRQQSPDRLQPRSALGRWVVLRTSAGPRRSCLAQARDVSADDIPLPRQPISRARLPVLVRVAEVAGVHPLERLGRRPCGSPPRPCAGTNCSRGRRVGGERVEERFLVEALRAVSGPAQGGAQTPQPSGPCSRSSGTGTRAGSTGALDLVRQGVPWDC